MLVVQNFVTCTIAVEFASFALMLHAQNLDGSASARLDVSRSHHASADGDSVLSPKETKVFITDAETIQEKEAEDDRLAQQYIYKTVGVKPLALYVWRPEKPQADGKAPAIVLFHGGGFKSGNYTQFREQARYFASRGMVAVSVNYRLTSEQGVKIEDCVEDAKSAMRWVRHHAVKLGVDPARIAAGGGSAGGFLAVVTLMFEDINAHTDPPGVSANPDALVLFNPAFCDRGTEDGKPSRRDPEGKGDLKKYIAPHQPPCICFYGSADPFLSGAILFQEAYKKAGNRCEIVTYKGETHRFFNKDKYRELTLAEADTFLVSLGWLRKEAKKTSSDDAE